MGDAHHTQAGSPFDNASVARRLGGEVFSVDVGGVVLEGFRAFAHGGGASTGSRPPAVLVHGWPQFASCWEGVAQGLLGAGVDVVAYDQRGYSPGAQPDDVSSYRLARLLEDLRGVVDALGVETFHLIGHDWGGIIGWSFAALEPDRLATFTSVSSAHPVAHGKRIQEDPDQYERMHYLRRIRSAPDEVERRLLADDGARLRALYDDAVPEEQMRAYVERFSQPGVMAAALSYYRALGEGEPVPTQPITVRTLYVWGSEDRAFTRGAAELTASCVEGEYRFLEIPGGTHWLPEEHPGAVAGAVIDWISTHA